jgi:hypothetical protein
MTDKTAQTKIAEILLLHAGDTAYQRLYDESRFAKQSIQETAMRVSGNLLRSFVTRKPEGCVETPER